MGGDGGVIANKRQFIRGIAKKEEEYSKKEKHLFHEQGLRATTCALTTQKLLVPIVACELGYLYNKEAIISALLDKNLPDAFQHIRGLKDVKTLQFTPNPLASSSSSSTTSDLPTPLIICPITKEEFNGAHNFVILWSTGHVISEKALKELGSSALQEEYGPFTSEDIIRLIPQEHEMEDLRVAMIKRRESHKKVSKKHVKESKESKESNEIDEFQEPKKKKIKGQDQKPSTTQGILSLSTKSQSIVSSVNQSIQQQEEQSAIYKKLFHKDHEKDRTDKDLFMTVAGLRYTLN